MKHNRGITFISTILLLILVLGLLTLAYVYGRKSGHMYRPPSGQTTGGQTTGNENPTPQLSYASHCGMTINSPAENATVAFPLQISGTVDNTTMSTLGCSWIMFEGQAGTAHLYYFSNNAWHPIGQDTIVPVLNWMTVGPTNFTMTMPFTNTLNLPSGTPMKIIFTEEDPAGNGNPDTLTLPLILS